MVVFIIIHALCPIIYFVYMNGCIFRMHIPNHIIFICVHEWLYLLEYMLYAISYIYVFMNGCIY